MRAKLIDDKPAIAVLGPATGDDTEDLAATVASSLASSGYTVIVSGNGHTAQSAKRSAVAQGGKVCVVINAEDAPEDSPVGGCTLMIRPSPLQCMEAVLDHADALVVLPGDLHAVAALLEVWSYGTTPDEPYRPVVLLGEAWPKLVKSVATAAGLSRKERAMVTFVSAVDEAVESLRYYISA